MGVPENWVYPELLVRKGKMMIDHGMKRGSIVSDKPET